MKKTNKYFLYKSLDELDFSDNNIVFIHSSMLKFGYYENGVSSFLPDLLSYFGSNVTVGMPTFTFSKNNSQHWTKARKSEVGSLTQKFLELPGTERTIHPTHSCGFNGPLAKHLSSIFTPCIFSQGGIFEILADLGATNIGIGVEFVGGATFLHTAEKQAQVFYRENIVLDSQCYDPELQKLLGGFTYFARKNDLQGDPYVNDWNRIFYKFFYNGLYSVRVKSGIPFSQIDMRKGLRFLKATLLEDPEITLRK